MKHFLPLCLLATVLLTNAVQAQVSLTVNSANSCQEEVLAIQNNSGKVIFQVDWTHDAVVFHSETAYDRTNGLLSAGGNLQGNAANQLRFPYDMAADKDGNVFVVDRNNNRIMRWNKGASTATLVVGGNPGNALNQISNPHGIAIDNQNRLYIADMHNHRIVRWDPLATQGVVVAGGNGPGDGLDQLHNPSGVAIAPNGDLYISDMRNARIMRWMVGEPQGEIFAGTGVEGSGFDQFREPMGIAVDNNFDVYVADRKNHRVVKWQQGATEGEVVAGFSYDYGSDLDKLNNPMDVDIDRDGNLLVADMFNHRVLKFSAGNPLGTLVAGGTQGFGLEFLNFPTGVFADTLGGIYVADHEMHRVVKWGLQLPALNYITQGTGDYEVSVVYEDAANEISAPIAFNRIPLPVADFAYEFEHLTYSFNDSSENAITYLWSFGDGSTSTSASPNHTYTYVGQYEVCLTVYDNCGHESSICQVVNVTSHFASDVNATLDISDTSWCNQATLTIQGVDRLLVQRTRWFRIPTNYHTSSLAYPTTGTRVAGSTLQGGQLFQLRFPQEVEVVGNQIYVVDRNNNRIVRWTEGAASGVVVAGGHGSGTALNQIRDPRGISVDNSGNLYVCDRNNHRIVYWASGATQGVVVAGGNGPGMGLNQLNFPSDFVKKGNFLYIADELNNRVIKWEIGAPQGTVIAGGPTHGSAMNQLRYPVSVAVDHNDAVYIVDRENQRVVRYDVGATEGILIAGGNGLGSALNQLNKPSDVVVDAARNVYIVDRENHRIVKWVPNATTGVLVAGGNEGNGNNQLRFPTGMSLVSNRIYIADNNNHRIMRWNITFPAMNRNTSGTGNYYASIEFVDGTVAITDTKFFRLNVVKADFDTAIADLDATFTNLSEHGETWLWNFDDGNTSTDENPVHHYRRNGTYNVCLTATDSCNKSNVFCQNITINAPYDIVYAASNILPTSQTASCNQISLNLDPDEVEVVHIDYIEWYKNSVLDATVTGPMPSLAYTTTGSGNYHAVLYFIDGTSVQTTNTVSFTYTPATPAFSVNLTNNMATFTNSSTHHTGVYAWDFDDSNTSTSSDPVHTFTANGTYNVCLTVSDTCGNDYQLCSDVVINLPMNFWNAAASLAGPSPNVSCDQESMSISGLNLGDVQQIEWFKDNVSYAVQNAPIASASMNTNGTGDHKAVITFTDASQIFTATVGFTYNPATPMFSFNITDNEVAFTNTSTNHNGSFAWDFDDSNTSTSSDPVHTFTANGTYNVCLTVSDSCGNDYQLCSDVVINLPLNFWNAGASLAGPSPNVSCDQESMSISGLNLADVQQIEWFKDNVSYAVQNAPIASASMNTNGTGDHKAVITFTDASQIFTGTESFTHNPAAAMFTFSISNYEVTFTNTSTNHTGVYDWDFDDLNTSTAANPVHTYLADGTYNVCLTVVDSCGNFSPFCTDVVVPFIAPKRAVTADVSTNSPYLQIYPNPSSDRVFIETTESTLNAELLDALGRKITTIELQNGRGEIDLSSTANGVYFVRIQNEAGPITQRLIKN